MSKGRFERKKEKAGAGKIILIILAVLLALVIAAVVAGVVYYNHILNQMNHVEVPKITYSTTAAAEETEVVETTEEATEPTETEHIPSRDDYVNILVVGQASRAGDAERMADTMILVTLNKYEKTLKMTSFLRDTLVHPPRFRNKSFGNIKLTTVYHLGSYYDQGNIAGSMELMNMTLYENFGIEVDYNFEVDFEAFVDVIDLMGGVGIELSEAEAKYLNKDDKWVSYDVEPGYFWLDGAGALSFARMRKAEGDGESDIKRTSRQRRLITSLFEHAQQMTLSEVQAIANQVLPRITTSMTNQEITDMLLTVLPMITELKIESSGTCPVEGTYWGKMMDIYDDGFMHSVILFHSSEQKKLMRELTLGEIAE